MCTRRVLTLAVFVVAFLATDPGIQAEVSAEVGDDGGYRRTILLANSSEKNLKIWAVTREKPRLEPLNPQGDDLGDLWPIIEEDPLNGNHPWVVWSRSAGDQYDLGWSRWTDAGWAAVQWVERYPSLENDLDPHLALDLNDGARPYVVWWREGADGGTVYLSVFLSTRWMAPYRVSDGGVDSRYPTVSISEEGSIEVTFTTDEGEVTRHIVFHKPDTIHDDLDPIGSFHGGAGDPGQGDDGF
jgi:hypothetical protein